MQAIYFHPRDRDGNLEYGAPASGVTSYEKIFRSTWKRRGLSDEEIESRWQGYLKEAAGQEKRHGD